MSMRYCCGLKRKLRTQMEREGRMLSVIKFIAVMLAGYMLKRLKIFSKRDIPVFSNAMLYITLPCAMAASTQSLMPDNSMLLLALLGLGVGALMLLIGYMASRRMDERTMLMVHLAGLNIGGFAVPFIQGLLPAGAVAFAGMYDIGNTCYGNGVSYLVPKALKEGGGRFPIMDMLKKLCRSAPLVTYIVFLILAFTGIRLPDEFFRIVREVGDCNFLIVFLIAGIAMDFHIDMRGLKTVSKFLIIKYGMGILLSLAVYYLMPAAIVVKRAVVICLLAPQTSTSVAYSELLCCDSKVYSAMYTCGILCTLIMYFVLSILWR